MFIFILITLFYEKYLMDNDCLVVIYKITFLMKIIRLESSKN